jgi:hypothetical protein
VGDGRRLKGQGPLGVGVDDADGTLMAPGQMVGWTEWFVDWASGSD